jgi:predicted DNA-binding protein (UPF0278 family)
VIAVDASVLIAHLDERDALHARAEEALLGAADQLNEACGVLLAAEAAGGVLTFDDGLAREAERLGLASGE